MAFRPRVNFAVVELTQGVYVNDPVICRGSRDHQVSILSAQVKRGPVTVTLGIHVCSLLDQGSRDLQVSTKSANVKRGMAIVIHGIHVGSFPDQGSRDLQVSTPSARVKRVIS